MRSQLRLCSGRPNTGQVAGRGHSGALSAETDELLFVTTSHPLFNVNLMLHVVRKPHAHCELAVFVQRQFYCTFQFFFKEFGHFFFFTLAKMCLVIYVKDRYARV